MSEVDKHYGQDPVGLDRTAKAEVEAEQARLAGVAAVAKARIQDAAEGASRVAERVRSGATEAYSQASTWAADSYESTARNATYARRRSVAHLNRGRRTVESFVEENPVMVGVAGLAAGLLVGALLPGTRRENQLFGRYSDEVREQGVRYARDVADQGKQMLDENLRHLRDTVRETSEPA